MLDGLSLYHRYVPPSCSDCSDQQHMDCDPLVSPALASTEMLRRLPPTSIMAAGLDPLLDDSVLFAHRYAVEFGRQGKSDDEESRFLVCQIA